MKGFLSYVLLFILLGIYLVIPFKHQFLNTLHFLSHIYQHENPYHHHNHAFNNHGHSHGFIEKVSHALEDNDNTHSIPADLTGYEFQPLFLPVFLYFTGAFPVFVHILFSGERIPALTGPCYKVPTPPP